MDQIVTEWVCENKSGWSCCTRRMGDMREVRIIDENNPDTAFIFVPSDIDLEKLSKTPDAPIGLSRVTGWPKFWPVFNRKRVYHYSYPGTGDQTKMPCPRND